MAAVVIGNSGTQLDGLGALEVADAGATSRAQPRSKAPASRGVQQEAFMRWQAGVEGRTPRRRLLGGVKPPWRRTVRGGERMPQAGTHGAARRARAGTEERSPVMTG